MARFPVMELNHPLLEKAKETEETFREAEEIRDVLKYPVLLDSMLLPRKKNDQRLSSYQREVQLFEACVEAGVRPFDTEAVEKYKERKGRNGFGSRIPNGFAAFLFTVVVLGAAGTLVALITSAPWQLSLSIGVLTLTAFAVLITAIATDYVSKWDEDSLSSYTKPVPVEALQDAMKIAKLLPNVHFRVHSLRRHQVYRDPLLSVHFGEVHFYIAVWDEPSFNAPLM